MKYKDIGHCSILDDLSMHTLKEDERRVVVAQEGILSGQCEVFFDSNQRTPHMYEGPSLLSVSSFLLASLASYCM